CWALTRHVTAPVQSLREAVRALAGGDLRARMPPALAARADVLLPVRALETDFIFKPSASRYAMLLVLDVLATRLALLQQDDSQERLRRLKYVL
ncbi:hypothetical protein OH413_24520, partial [Salmonella enterica]|nr:hypothetical protein [Salmonella enterica]